MKNILVLLFSFIVISCQAQNESLHWVKTFGGIATETGKIIRNDSEGNLFIVGNFMGTVDFDPGPGIENSSSNGGNDIYILKLNSEGNFLWVRTYGSTANDICEKAQVDKMDNIVVTGHFVNSLDFDPSANVDMKTSNGLSDIYILKLDNAGNYLWTKTFGAAGHDLSRGLSINSTNDICISGRFLHTVDFDPGPGVVNKSALGGDIYILQINAAGNFNWVKTLECPANSSVQVNDLICDKNNNILIDASYKDSIDVDPGPNTQYLIDSADPLQYNLFILKLDANGNYVWAKQFNNSVGNSVGVSILSYDSVGNYYLGGFFFGNVDFDFGPASYSITTPKSASYILKIDSNANFIWAKHMGGFSGNLPEYETVFGIAIDSQSNVSLCGAFKGYEDFDPGPGVYYLGQPGMLTNTRGYIMQLDSTGNLKWAKNISDEPAAASVNSILLNKQGKIYVAGDFYHNTDFDFNAGINYVMAQGDWDAFVLKMKNCVNTTATDVINSCTPITWIDGNTYTLSNFTAMHTLNSAEGCDSVVTLNLTITTIAIDTSISIAGNTLTANATGVNYQWVDCVNGMTPLAGATNQSFTPSSSGSYAVVITNGLCKDTSSCYSFTVLGVDNITDNSISVFPNPAHGTLNIITRGQAITFCLYNVLGQLIMVRNFSEKQQEHSLDLSNISKGLYNYIIYTKSLVPLRDKLIIK